MNQPAAKLIRMGPLRKLGGWGLGWFAAMARVFAKRRGADERVLILEPFGMGDVISLEPMVRALREAGKEVTICAQSRWRGLYDESVKWLDADLPWTTYQDQSKYALGGYFSARFRQFRAQLKAAAAGSIGLDPRGDVRSILLLRLAGCSRVVSLSCYLGSDLVVPPDCAERAIFDPSLQRWQNNLRLTRKVLGEATAGSPPTIEHLRPGRSRRQIAFIPVAPWKGKLWRRDRWIELREELERERFPVVVLHGPGQAEAARAEVGADAELHECGSIAEWAETLTSMRSVISVDTGPMHLAAALGVPVVGLFGQGLLPLWSPAGRQCVAVHHQAEPGFVPCHPIESNASIGARWMEKISVREVLDALRR